MRKQSEEIYSSGCFSYITRMKLNFLQKRDTKRTRMYKKVKDKGSPQTVIGYNYKHDEMANITQVQERKRVAGSNTGLEQAETKISYVYDDQNQLIRDNNVYLDQTIVYTYDNGGNLTSKKFYAYTTDEDLSALTPEEVTYSCDSTWKDKLVSYNGEAITYDEIDNPLSYRGKTLTWTGRTLNTLTAGDETSKYVYDASGMRTKKTVGSEVSEYYYSDGQLDYEKRGSKELYYTYDNDGNLLAIRYVKEDGTAGTYYPAVNSRGDVDAIYNYKGELVAQYRYDSWGKLISVKDAEGNAITDENHIGLVNPIRYRGYYYDTETGFYYVSSRYYDPEIGRFLNADGKVSGIGGDVRGYNMYSYCFNNPVNMFDPTGNWPRWISAAVAGVATIVAAVTAAPAAVAIAVGATVTYGLQVLHYDIRQSNNKNLPKTPKEADDAKWRNSNPKTSSNPNGGGPAASCHQNTSKNKTNVKYVSPDGKREVIFDAVGNVVNDPRDIGTYNFKPSSGAWYSKESISHAVADILPWIFLGNSDDDWGPVINFFIN